MKTKFGPLVLKSSLVLTFIIGFILNILQLLIYFDFSHLIGEEMLLIGSGTYAIYFLFLSSINTLAIAGYLIDYIGDKFDENRKRPVLEK